MAVVSALPCDCLLATGLPAHALLPKAVISLLKPALRFSDLRRFDSVAGAEFVDGFG